MAGVSDLGVALAPGRVRRREHALVAADRAADLGGGRLDAEDQHGVHRRPGRPGSHGLHDAPAPARADHRRPDRREREHAVVVAVAEGEPHLEVVGGQRRQDGVAPLDEHHRRLVEHLGEPEVERPPELLEAVDVEVVQREPARVLAARA